jgi:hypothetical protein
MRSITRTLAIALSIGVILTGASIARADGSSSWPSDQDAQLAQLDAQLIDVQQKLFTAKQTNDAAGTDQYTAEFNQCQSQRLTLLQAMGLVSASDLNHDD